MRSLPLVALLLLAACNVDETGYFVPPEVGYTAETELGPSEQEELIVIGRPGALAEVGGTLTIENQRSGEVSTAVVDGERGSFAGRIAGALGDVLSLRYELDGDADELALQIDDPLGQVRGPDCTVCAGTLVGPPEGGLAPVFLTQLDDPTPPFVVANLASGATLRVDDVSDDPRIPAATGDLVCVYRLSVDAARSSTAACGLVPDP